MRVPSSLLTSEVAISRKTRTGSGVITATVSLAEPARVTETVKTTYAPQGVTALVITNIYLAPEADVLADDVLTLPSGEKVTVRSVSKPSAPTTAAVTIVEAW